MVLAMRKIITLIIVIILLCVIIVFSTGLTYKNPFSPLIQEEKSEESIETKSVSNVRRNVIAVKPWLALTGNSVENIKQDNLLWHFNMTDPLRTYEEYHGDIILYADGTGKCRQCIYNEIVQLERPYDNDGYSLVKWSFNRDSLLLTIDWTYGGQYDVGGYYEGIIKGDINKFDIKGHWYTGTAGTIHFENVLISYRKNK